MPIYPPPDPGFADPTPDDRHDPDRTAAECVRLCPDEPSLPGATIPLRPASGVAPTAQSGLPQAAVLPTSDGRYRVDYEIARGAMGLVFKGRDLIFCRDVAIKLLLEEHLEKPELRQRFMEEARITARLQHPAIVPVYAIGEFPGGRPFYVMRLVNGRTLAELLDSRLDIREDRSLFLKVFEKVCEGLAYAHTSGVIHRDLKPANIMVARFGMVKLMDWGVAKVMPHSPLADWSNSPRVEAEAGRETPSDGSEVTTQFGRVLGTPAYMAPEHARGHIDQLDERTDVFGLGGILCAILSGQPPYTGANSRGVYKQAARADLIGAFNRLDRCGADPELIALCKRCLAPAPAERPRDAGILAAELTECLAYDLRRTEQDLIRFFELSLDLFCIAGLNGYFRRVNSNFSRVLGHSTETLLSQPYLNFVHPDDRERTLAVVAKLSQGLPCVQFRNRYRDIHGAYRWFEWTAKSILEEQIIFAVARDVTDQIRLEDRLRNAHGT